MSVAAKLVNRLSFINRPLIELIISKMPKKKKPNQQQKKAERTRRVQQAEAASPSRKPL